MAAEHNNNNNNEKSHSSNFYQYILIVRIESLTSEAELSAGKKQIFNVSIQVHTLTLADGHK